MTDKQVKFMRGCGQTTLITNYEQVELYLELIREEVVKELFPATLTWLADPLDKNALRDMLDGAGDSLVVVQGLIYSLGLDPEMVKERIDKSNLTKIPQGSQEVRHREDGKILKPDTFEMPKLDDLVDNVISNIANGRTE